MRHATGQRFHTPKIIDNSNELGEQKLDFDENLSHIFNNMNALSDTQSEKRKK